MNTHAVIVKDDAPLEWGRRGEIAALAKRFRAMLPNNSDMTDAEILTAAQYARVMDLNPFRGEVYFYKSRGKLCVVDGYKALARWAKNEMPYTDRYDSLPVDDGELVKMRCWILREDRKPFIREYVDLGANFQEAFEIAATYADGVVTVNDTKDNRGNDRPPPVGWTWEQVARKRAFKNAINLSHGAPSPREIAKQSWEVNGIQTIPEDWDGAEELTAEEIEKLAELRARTRETLEAFDALPPEAQQIKAAENSRALYGDADFQGFDATPPPQWDQGTFDAGEDAAPDNGEEQPAPAPPKKRNGKVASINSKQWSKAGAEFAQAHPYYMKGDQVDWYHLTGAASKLGFREITDENLADVLDALRTHAHEQAGQQELPL